MSAFIGVGRVRSVVNEFIKAYTISGATNLLHFLAGWESYPEYWSTSTEDFKKGFNARFNCPFCTTPCGEEHCPWN